METYILFIEILTMVVRQFRNCKEFETLQKRGLCDTINLRKETQLLNHGRMPQEFLVGISYFNIIIPSFEQLK